MRAWGIRLEGFNAVRENSEMHCRGGAPFFEIYLDLLYGRMFRLKCSEPFLGGLLAPPFFGYLVDVTGTYGYSWLFLSGCALTILVLLAFYKESRSSG